MLYWTERFFPAMGGTEILGASIVQGLTRRGIEFEIVTSHEPQPLPDEDHFDGIPLHRLHFWDATVKRDIALLAATRKRVEQIRRNFQPDVVHLNASGPSLFFQVLAHAAQPTPWIFTPHAPLADQKTGSQTILGQAFDTADRTVCVSGAQREQILRIAPGVVDRAVLIYNSLVPQEEDPAPLPRRPSLLFIGRLAPEKAADVAIDAVARLVGRFPDVRLTIVGEGPDRETLERQVAELGLDDNVTFAGRVPETRPYYDRAALVLMPSRWEETFGLIALETALYGRPIVATRVGALPEVVADGVTGILVPKDDPVALADGAAHLLGHPDVTERMGQAARARALERFSLEAMLDAYEALYHELAHTPR